MPCQSLTRAAGSESMNNVKNAIRQPSFLDDMPEQVSSVRRPLCWLKHASVSHHQTRSNLPCRKIQRQIPGGNKTRDSKRLVESKMPLSGVDSKTFLRQCLGIIGEERKVHSRARNVTFH